MTTVRLTRVVRFSAAHRYFRPEWSADRNAQEFGACAGEHGHGHSYECHVTVSGRPTDDTSMVMRLDQLDDILREEISERFDHRYINYEVPEFEFGKKIPTAEALAVYIWESVKQRLPPAVELVSVRVQEEPSLFAEYRGED